MKSSIRFVARTSLLLTALALLPGCGDEGMEPPLELVTVGDTDPGADLRPQVTLTVSNGAGVEGTLIITLVPEHAPVTVENFLTYVNSGFYDGTIIHRYQENFVMQGGSFASPVAADGLPTRKPTSIDPIPLEIKVSNVLGTVAMARLEAPNSATSGFFINLVNNSFLNTSAGGYAAFGYISDLAPVNALKLAPCVSSTITAGTGLGCLPVPNLVITSAVQTRF